MIDVGEIVFLSATANYSREVRRFYTVQVHVPTASADGTVQYNTIQYHTIQYSFIRT